MIKISQLRNRNNPSTTSNEEPNERDLNNSQASKILPLSLSETIPITRITTRSTESEEMPFRLALPGNHESMMANTTSISDKNRFQAIQSAWARWQASEVRWWSYLSVNHIERSQRNKDIRMILLSKMGKITDDPLLYMIEGCTSDNFQKSKHLLALDWLLLASHAGRPVHLVLSQEGIEDKGGTVSRSTKEWLANRLQLLEKMCSLGSVYLEVYESIPIPTLFEVTLKKKMMGFDADEQMLTKFRFSIIQY